MKVFQFCSSSSWALPFIFNASLVASKKIWSTLPADANDLIRTTYPLGNGRLGAMPIGPAGLETLTLNLDSLWSGGPFEVSNYTGGNPLEPKVPVLQGIRDWIFENGTGNVTELVGSDGFYGSYQVLANLSVAITGMSNTSKAATQNYSRALDLKNGVHTTRFKTSLASFETSAFCSFPDQACVYTINSTDTLPQLEITLDNALVTPELRNLSCSSGKLELRGVTQRGPPAGMKYNAIAQLLSGSLVDSTCEGTKLIIVPKNGTRNVGIVISAGTNYDIEKGTKEHNYSFRGEDPKALVEQQAQSSASKSLKELLEAHLEDFNSLTDRFTLSIPDVRNSSTAETRTLVERYNSNDTAGDPYLESLLFDHATYLFISSSRPGSLPPNLQGRWSETLTPEWSADYHANINFQENHWTPDQTGLTDLQSPLWDYMMKTWMPRGKETAELLYGAPGWVVHNEMNIFGHTAMKSGAEWANYQAAAAWMMQHVWDHWEYSQDVEWLKAQGYPMIKGVAEFWLNQLQEDNFFKDGTLVVNPCNSPEHGPTTFGCAHNQQLIHQVFEAVLTARELVSEEDTAFIRNVSQSLARLDKGFHIGAWGQIKEWKLPDSFGYDFENDTHRHLSELVGWYPGYSLSSFMNGYNNATIQRAVEQKLYSRGPGKLVNGNAGWNKVWRAACWARLNNTERAHFQLRFAIEQNFLGNGLSLYFGKELPFQIDANFGYGGAVLSMLVVDMPQPFGANGPRTVVLGPAIPESWAGGSVKGLRLRGGAAVDFAWDDEGLVNKAAVRDGRKGLRIVNKADKVLWES